MNKKTLLLSAIIGMTGCHKPAFIMSDAEYLARIHHADGFNNGRDAIISAVEADTGIGGSPKRAYRVTGDEFKAAVKELEASGHIDDTATGMWEMVLGRYDWYSIGRAGSFGMYVLYPPAVEQAGRSWYVHVKVAPNSDLVVAQGTNVRFDQTAIGHSIDGIYQPKSQKMLAGKVIELIDARTLRIDQRADSGGGEQFDLAILPPNYVDMCNCMVGGGGGA